MSINNVLSETPINTNKKSIDTPLWYALCTTHGREEKEYDYLTSKNIVASCPTFKKIKIVDGNSIAINKTRIPNIFFAFATEEELKTFVYDNVNQPYLRFYYRHIIRTADYYDIAASAEDDEKFKSCQKVRIIDGKFKGAVARYHSQQRIGIIIDGLQVVCTAFVPSAFIENTYIKKFELRKVIILMCVIGSLFTLSIGSLGIKLSGKMNENANYIYTYREYTNLIEKIIF